MKICMLCEKECKENEKGGMIKDEEFVSIPDVVDKNKIYHIHVKCFQLKFGAPVIKCPRCGAKVQIQHQFFTKNEPMVECDYVPYHRDPSMMNPKNGALGARKRTEFELNLEAEGSICPLSQHKFENGKIVMGKYIETFYDDKGIAFDSRELINLPPDAEPIKGEKGVWERYVNGMYRPFKTRIKKMG